MKQKDVLLVFKFLDELRESGITNMWGATPYIVEACEIPKDQAKKLHVAWIETFSTTESVEKRVELAMKKL